MLERIRATATEARQVREPGRAAPQKESPMTTPTLDRIRVRRPRGGPRSGRDGHRPIHPPPEAPPIVVAVDNTRAARAATAAAVRLAQDLVAPLVFVYVRRGPSPALGRPYYQRRLDSEISHGPPRPA
jgi:hypothetical protein